MYLHAKINFIPPIVFEILKFKNPASWLAESIFAFNSRTRYFPDMQFSQNQKDHYSAWFQLKKSAHQWTIFFFLFAKSKKPYFGGVFGHYPQNETFSQKSGSARFLPLRHPNFMRSFRNMSRFGGNAFTYWYTDVLTVVKS